MSKSPLTFNFKISTKLLCVNMLVFIFIAGILAVVLVSFSQTEKTITTITHRDVTRISENSRTGRELTGIFADLLTSIFYGNKDAGQAGLEHLETMIEALQEENTGMQLQIVLQQFSQKLTALLEQSANLKTLSLQFSEQENEFAFNVDTLTDVIQEKIEDAADEHSPVVTHLKQLQATILGSREAFHQIISQVTELQRTRSLSSDNEESAATQPQRSVQDSLDFLLLRLQTIHTTNNDEILEYGQELEETVKQYKAMVVEFQEQNRAFQSLFQEVTVSKDEVIAALKQQEEHIAQTVQNLESTLEEKMQQFSHLIMVLVGMLFIAIVFSSYVARKMVKPLIHLACVARGIAKGEVNFHLDEAKTQDEIGVLTTEFLNMRAYLQRVTNVAERISHGNLDLEISPKSDQDVLNHSLITMREKISAVLRETQELIQATQEGKLDIRGDAEGKFEGTWRELVVGLNNLIDAFVVPINTSAEYIDRVAQGDIPEKIVEEYQGDFEKIRQNLNKLFEAMNDITHFAEQIALGNVTVTLQTHSSQYALTRALNTMLDSLKEVTAVAEEMARGNLSVKVNERSEHDTLMQTLNAMILQLSDTVITVKEVADHLASGSENLSENAVTLSQGATQQAAATEEISASMEQMVANIKQNATNARQTEQIALQSANYAEEAGKVVAETLVAMQQIAEKIVVIQEIATQTRLLSLNATIESSRAQEHGKAFSVVAAEVRKLSDVTKHAAEEIGQLATSTVEISRKAGDMLATLIPSIHQTAEFVQEITAACGEQSSGAEHINEGVQQLDQTSQQSAAASEEVSSMAEELASQARQLQTTMSYFTLRERLSGPFNDASIPDAFNTFLSDYGLDDVMLLELLLQRAQESSRTTHEQQSDPHAEKNATPEHTEQTEDNAPDIDEKNDAQDTDERDSIDSDFERY